MCQKCRKTHKKTNNGQQIFIIVFTDFCYHFTIVGIVHVKCGRSYRANKDYLHIRPTYLYAWMYVCM